MSGLAVGKRGDRKMISRCNKRQMTGKMKGKLNVNISKCKPR